LEEAGYEDRTADGGVGGFLLALALAVGTSSKAEQDAGAEVKPVATEKLPNVPGKNLTALAATMNHWDEGATLGSCITRASGICLRSTSVTAMWLDAF
jgi:hypothetical protein